MIKAAEIYLTILTYYQTIVSLNNYYIIGRIALNLALKNLVTLSNQARKLIYYYMNHSIYTTAKSTFESNV